MKRFLLLRQALLAHDMQQKDAARIMGLCDGALSARLYGRADFTATDMIRLGNALGIDPGEYYAYFLADSAATQAGGRA